MHFSKIIELKFGKRMPYYGYLIISEKTLLATFFFLDSSNPCQNLLSPPLSYLLQKYVCIRRHRP